MKYNILDTLLFCFFKLPIDPPVNIYNKVLAV